MYDVIVDALGEAMGLDPFVTRVRVLGMADEDAAENLWGDDGSSIYWDRGQPPAATLTLPNTPEREEVYRQRLRQGYQLHHPGDAHKPEEVEADFPEEDDFD